MAEVTVVVQRDHIYDLARRSQPVYAIIELIWNALDADASLVRVDFERNPIGGIEAVRVSDDGSGIAVSRVRRAFGNLGGSWKAGARVTEKKRPMHGKSGRGRFRALALGNNVKWTTVADDTDGRFLTTIQWDGSTPERFTISDPVEVVEDPNTIVEISQKTGPLTSLESEATRRRITREFARYLLRYKDIEIHYDNEPIDPRLIMITTHEEALPAPVEGYGNASLEVIEWSDEFPRELVLCDENGFGLADYRAGIHAPTFYFTAFVSWAGLSRSDAHLAELGNEKSGLLLQAARERLKQYFRERAEERRREMVELWKEQGVYPFKGPATDDVERAKRDLFDIVAIEALPGIPAEPRPRKLSLRLIAEALERSPTSLHKVLGEVLELTLEQIADLAKLLDRTSLSSMISATRLVADRLDCLAALDYLLFDPEAKKSVVERRQLHRILANEPWVFGEQYSVTVDDKSIHEVLRRHLALLGRKSLNIDPVQVEGKQRAIVDLMLSRTQRKPAGYHHLVVELKRPTVIISYDEVKQISQYAMAVARDQQFRDSRTEWDFLLIGNEISEDIRGILKGRNLPPGCYSRDEDLRLAIWIKEWGEILDERRRGLHFVREELSITPSTDEALEFLRTKHAAYAPRAAQA